MKRAGSAERELLANMPVAILAGGRGLRMGSNNDLPKPLTPIGDRPVLVHLMNAIASQGFRQFVVATGQKAQAMDAYFGEHHFEYDVRLVYTGDDTNTGGRLRRLRPFLGDGTCLLSWADGLWDIDLLSMLDFHRHHGCLATVAAVMPRSQFGILDLDRHRVTRMQEKPVVDGQWINAGVFYLEHEALDYVTGDGSSWEADAMTRLAEDGQLAAYRHRGFWQCMDSPKDAEALNRLYREGQAPWLAGSQR